MQKQYRHRLTDRLLTIKKSGDEVCTCFLNEPETYKLMGIERTLKSIVVLTENLIEVKQEVQGELF